MSNKEAPVAGRHYRRRTLGDRNENAFEYPCWSCTENKKSHTQKKRTKEK